MQVRCNLCKRERRGAATVEFAILLPLLMFLFGIGVDWARAFYYHLTITNAARNGAIWGCDSPDRAVNAAEIEAIVRRDTASLGEGVTVGSSVVTSGGVNYVRVKVSYAFQPLTGLPGTPASQTIYQTVEMRVIPTQPRPGTY